MEQLVVSGIAYSRDEAKVTVRDVPDRPGVAAEVFGCLSDANINVDMIVQNISEENKTTDITFTVAKADLRRTLEAVKPALEKLPGAKVVSDDGVAKISIIGVGMRSHTGIARTMFETLA